MHRTTVTLKRDARPALSIGVDGFYRQIDGNGLFWGIPERMFSVERGTVYVRPALAERLTWAVDERMGGGLLNINAVAQRVTVGGASIRVEAGALCSFIAEENVNDT